MVAVVTEVVRRSGDEVAVVRLGGHHRRGQGKYLGYRYRRRRP